MSESLSRQPPITAQDDADLESPLPPIDGVRRAAWIALVAAAVAVIPYLVPGLEPYRAWVPGEPVPLAHIVEDQPSLRSGIAALTRRPAFHDDDTLMRRAPLPSASDDRPRQARRRDEDPGEPERPPLPRIPAEEFAGLSRGIDDPTGAMNRFYARLGRVARREPVLARISVYGTSINGADRATSVVRARMQAIFGDGGKGWVPVAPGWRYQRHQDVRWTSDHWDTFVVNRGDGPLDRYGFGGVVAINRHRRAISTFETTDEAPGDAVSTFRVFHQAWPEGGELSLQLDDEPPRIVSTRADEVEDRVETIRARDGAHRLTLRAHVPDGHDDEAGEAQQDLRLYGVAMERAGPGVVVDGLALIGAFTRVLRLFDDDHLRAQVAQREPDLVVFWMGANDAVSQSVPYLHDQYVGYYRQIVRRFRAGRPGMSCLVMSILDKGERVRGHIRTRDRVPELVDAQREVAVAEGCAFFDAYRALGGSGTMRRWYQASPRLVTADLGHLTDAGSRVTGTVLYRALIKGYDDWIADGEPN
ncbi:MAG: GDSL-type esterase/lipase family protein [Sandaracinaceae bacterium]